MAKPLWQNNSNQELESLDYRVVRHSLGFKVKQIGSDLFGMTIKDRPLLQKIGMKMREIRPAVWIEYVNRSIEEDFAADKYDVAIVDDVRNLLTKPTSLMRMIGK